MKATKETNRHSSTLTLVIIGAIFLAIVMMSIFYALADSPAKVTSQKLGTGIPKSDTEITSSENAIIYNQEIQGAIVQLNSEDNIITLHNCTTNEDISLKFSRGTNFLDKYGKYITSSQLSIGMIAQAFYIEEESKLVKLQISPTAFEKIGVTNVIINEEQGIFSFNGRRYPLAEGAIAFQDSQAIPLGNIHSLDYVNVRGIGDEICSVVVTKGHGYLELANEEEYLGGNIYVGTEDSKQIIENLQVTVREGTYTVTVINKDLKGSKDITIVKNKTSVFDLIDYGAPAVSTGLVHFDISPSNAFLYIDGKTMNYDSPIELTYGEHEIEVSLGGYISYQGSINVTTTDKTLRIVLPENKAGNSSADTVVDETDSNNGTDYNNNTTDTSNQGSSENDQENANDESGNTTDDSSSEDTSSEDNENAENTEDNDSSTDDSDADTSEGEDTKVNDEETEYEEDSNATPGIDSSSTMTITCTNGTKVYIDNKYIGKISDGKLVTKKYYGKHTLELILDGYQKKSYTINLDNDGKDSALNFPGFQ